MVFLRNQEISVRTETKGGEVQEVDLGPGETVLGKSCVILLIHGYCNDLDDARESYSTFAMHCLRSKGASLNVENMFRFYWPGDKPWGWLRVLSYPLEIKFARESAEALERFLRDLRHFVDLYIVAHSLGNRLVLELLKRIHAESLPPNVQLRAVCMMAAAVPVSYVAWLGDFHQAAKLTKMYVLYSPGDRVLKGAFRFGEIFDAPDLLPEAVGLNGNPLSLWWRKRKMTYGKGKQYDHPDYWRRRETTVPVTSVLTSSARSPSRNALTSRTLPPSNQLVKRFLAKYRTPVRF